MKLSELQTKPEYVALFNKLGDVIGEAIGNGVNGAVVAFALADSVSSVIASIATQVEEPEMFLGQWIAVLLGQIQRKGEEIVAAGGIEAAAHNPGPTARIFKSPENTTRH